MSFIVFPGGLFKSPRPTWIIEAFTYLHSWHSWCVASVGWGFPRLSTIEKQDVQRRGMNEHLRVISTVMFIYNPASALLFPGLPSTSPPVQWRDVTVENAGADLCQFCFGSWGLPVNTCTFQSLWCFYWRSLSWQLLSFARATQRLDDPSSWEMRWCHPRDGWRAGSEAQTVLSGSSSSNVDLTPPSVDGEGWGVGG